MSATTTYLEMIMVLPLCAGILFFAVPARFRQLKGILSLIVGAVILYVSVGLYLKGDAGPVNLLQSGFLSGWGFSGFPAIFGEYTMMNLDGLSLFIMMLIGFFSFLILIYSTVFVNSKNQVRHYYSFVLLTLWASAGAVLSDSLFMFIFFWGILGFTLYKLVQANDTESSAAAKKTFIIIGASDGIMILGIAILWRITGQFNITAISVGTTDVVRVTAFLALMIGSFAKAGAFPFHSWVPDFAKNAPAPSSAYLPASLDKLLGIYFLTRICNEIFVLGSGIRMIILILGMLTIIIAVMMALIQHNYKKLLGYHAVSQVGYMVTGIGLGSVLGLVGGLFHMVNHALYKSGLFLSAGNVQFQTGKENIEDLGGLSRHMPVTFVCSLIFALSISGIPPFNGFASKWIIYQGIIDFGHGAALVNRLWIVWLALAVIGSALTLASFIKFIAGIFLGRDKPASRAIHEVKWPMWIPVAVLALACTGFGVLASPWVVPHLLEPITGTIQYTGLWNSGMISILIAISVLLGILIYLIFAGTRFRTAESFVGGETSRNETGFEAVSFYDSIRNSMLFKPVYEWANRKYFDLYDVSKGLILRVSHLFSAAHNGILSNLAFWVLAGLIFMFIFLLM